MGRDLNVMEQEFGMVERSESLRDLAIRAVELETLWQWLSRNGLKSTAEWQKEFIDGALEYRGKVMYHIEDLMDEVRNDIYNAALASVGYEKED